jgi:hypothetical protein
MGGLNFLVTSVGCMLAGIGGLWSARWLIAP